LRHDEEHFSHKEAQKAQKSADLFEFVLLCGIKTFMPVSLEDALSFVGTEGIVFESAHGRVATFADFVAGERVTRWWSHSKGKLIFALTRAIRDSPDVLTCRLVDGKVTYVHRRLWPALVKLSGELDKSGLGAIREEHSPDGKHVMRVTEFPEWVPDEVLRESKRLTQREARSTLSIFLR
jgi:hypothetical protein